MNFHLDFAKNMSLYFEQMKKKRCVSNDTLQKMWMTAGLPGIQMHPGNKIDPKYDLIFYHDIISK